MSAPTFAPEAPSVPARLRLVPVADLAPEATSWLWPRYLPCGKLAILQGDPGIGKSNVSTDLAARVTRGDALPDGSRGATFGRPLAVLLLVDEDSAADTVVPRLLAAGADRSRVSLIRRARGTIKLPHDAEALRAVCAEAVARYGPLGLIVVDPLADFADSALNLNNAQEARDVLRVLGEIAEHFGCTVLVNHHLNKRQDQSALQRGAGSLSGIGGKARAVLHLAHDPGHRDGPRILTVAKLNVGQPGPSLSYTIASQSVGTDSGGHPIETSHLVWGGVSALTADDVSRAFDPDASSKLTHAREWLQDYLASGPRAASDVQDAARRAGISISGALRRAREELCEAPEKGADGKWLWTLSSGAPATPAGTP